MCNHNDYFAFEDLITCGKKGEKGTHGKIAQNAVKLNNDPGNPTEGKVITMTEDCDVNKFNRGNQDNYNACPKR